MATKHKVLKNSDSFDWLPRAGGGGGMHEDTKKLIDQINELEDDQHLMIVVGDGEEGEKECRRYSQKLANLRKQEHIPSNIRSRRTDDDRLALFIGTVVPSMREEEAEE